MDIDEAHAHGEGTAAATAAVLRDLHILLAPCPWAIPQDEASVVQLPSSSLLASREGGDDHSDHSSNSGNSGAAFPPTPAAAADFRARTTGPLRRLLLGLLALEEADAGAAGSAAAATAKAKWYAAQSVAQLAGLAEGAAARFFEGVVGTSGVPPTPTVAPPAMSATAGGGRGGGGMAAGGYRPLHPYLANLEGVLLPRHRHSSTAEGSKKTSGAAAEGGGHLLVLTPSTREKLRALAVELAAADDAAFGGGHGAAGQSVSQVIQ